MKDGPFERKWLSRLVNQVCKAAETRIVTPHGMRNTFSSVQAALAGKTATEIADILGHDDGGKTARQHYIGVPEHRRALELPSAPPSGPVEDR